MRHIRCSKVLVMIGKIDALEGLTKRCSRPRDAGVRALALRSEHDQRKLIP